MMKKKYSCCKAIVMVLMLMCVIWIGGECIVEAQTPGQIICTNNKNDYPDATVLKTSNNDFFASTYVRDGKKVNPLELHIKQDTTLVINGPLTRDNSNVGYRQINDKIQSVNAQERNYLEGILVYPGKKLTIKLESKSNFYVYGKKEPHSNGKDWIGHAGIEVPYSATLIIEKTKNVSGALIALGSSSKGIDDTGNGTGAGIGGRGYEFFKKANVYKGDAISGDYTYSDCGTVIIRSGTIYACGGCGVGEDGKGTGAGIGGGGVWKGKDAGHGGSIYSGKGGNIRIYGGKIEAYGGGTFNNNGDEKNIYGNKQDIFFNSSNGFYITNLGTVSDDQAEGTGAGIGGGGLYVDNELDVYMNTDLALKYYGGTVDAFAGRGSRRTVLVSVGSNGVYEEESSDSRGVGAGIGGGGGFASDGDMKSRATFKKCQAVELGANCGYNVDDNMYSNKKITSHYAYGVGSAYSGGGSFAKLGGWCCNGKNCHSYNDAGTVIQTKMIENYYSYYNAISEYPIYKYPKEAYSDVVVPKVESISYMICEFDNLETEDVVSKLTGFKYNSVESAIEGQSIITSKSNLVAKIVLTDRDTGYVDNFDYTIGHGIKEISVTGSRTITLRDMYESYSKGEIKKISSGVYVKVLNGGYFDSNCYGSNIYDQNNSDKDRLTFYASRVEVYIITREDFDITVKDIVDNSPDIATTSVKMHNSIENLNISVLYTLEDTQKKKYSNVSENNAYRAMPAGETVVKEKITATVTSSLSNAASDIKKMILKDKMDTVVESKENNNILEFEIDNSDGRGKYCIEVESKFGTTKKKYINISMVGVKRPAPEEGFPIPSVLPDTVSVDFTNCDLVKDIATYQSPEVASTTSPSPESVESIGTKPTISDTTISSANVSNIELNTEVIDNLSVDGIRSMGMGISSDLDKIDWNKNQKVDWDKDERKITEVSLQYKDVESTDSRELPVYQDSQIRCPIDTDYNIHINGNSKSYVVGYYTQNRSVSGNGTATLDKYSGTYSNSNKIRLYTTISDINFEGDKAISISCTYDKDSGKAKAILEPKELIVGSSIKEVGVRVEYTLNGITTGLVRRCNYVEGKDGVFEWTLKNIPKKNVTCNAYYITRDNEEFCSPTITVI